MGRKAKNKMSLAEFYATVGDGAAPAQDLPTAPASEEERQRQREEKERRYQSFNRDRAPDFSRGPAGANAGEPKPSDADKWESGQVVQAPARESQGFNRYSNFGDDSRRGWGRDSAAATGDAKDAAPERPAEPVNWRDNPNPVDRPSEGFGGFGARRSRDGPNQQGDTSQPPQRPVRTTEADNANDWRSMPRVVPTPEEAPRSRFEGGFRNREEDGRPRREDGDRERPRFGNFGRGPSATEGRQSTESRPVTDEGSWRRAADTEERPKVDQGSWRSSAPQREQQNRDAPQRKPRSNPFGDARPRDEPTFERKPLPLDGGNAQ